MHHMVSRHPDVRSRRAGRRRWSRRRLALVAIAVSATWKLLLVGLGGAVAALALDDGLDALPSEMRAYGVESREIARSLWHGPIERHSIREIRVVSVEQLTEQDAISRCGGLSARVRAYTFFAIPYSEVRTVCDRGTVEFRGLPHRPR